VRIFLDANVLFSAAQSAGAVRALLERAEAAGHALCADTYAAAEARRNLQWKAPETIAVLTALLARIELAGFEASPVPAEVATVLPAKDQPVLAAAIRLHCHVLVTGDRTHFGPLYGRVVKGVAVHSPRSLAAVLGFIPAA